MSKTYDIFLSYAHSDKEAVLPLRDALRAAGLEVWFDESAVENFSAVSHTVGDGLSVCKALLAFYSRTYPTRRACQWELTAAYVAAQRLGEPSRRILVVNPEPDSRDHIQPATLRDTLLPPFPAPDDAAGMRALAESVRRQVAALEKTLGDVGPMLPPRWHPIAAMGSPRFVGRVPDLWAIHSTLHAAEYPLTTGQHTRVVFVSGFGGIGKTLLAEEYALRFGAAYPGGVFWLRAFGGDPERADLGPEMREAERDRQIREIARSLGLTVEDLPLTQVRGMIAGELQRAGKPALWVVDDLPEGLASDNVRAWLAPHPFAATLVTTRSREYGALGNVLRPGVLPADEGYALLTFQRKPANTAEEKAARDIVTELGSHALAVEIAGAALYESSDRSFAEFHANLCDPTYDELALAAELAPVLPTERKEGIAAMLARSVVGLSPDARKVLVIASLLPPSPIPDSILIDTLTRIEKKESDREAKHRARLALAETGRRSLAERAGENAHVVHPLVLRAVRFSAVVGLDELRQTLLQVMHAEMERLNALPPAQAESAVVPHAHALVINVSSELEEQLMAVLGKHAYRTGRYGTAADLNRRLVAYAEAARGGEALATVDYMNTLAVTLIHLGDIAGSQVLQRKVLKIRRRIQGDEHRDTLASMSNLAASLAEQRKTLRSKKLNEMVLEIRRRVLGPEHPDTLTSMSNLAVNLGGLGDKAGARELDEKVLEIRSRVLGHEHPSTLESMGNLAASLAEEGDNPAAQVLEQRVLELRRRVLGEEHPDTLASMHNLAIGALEAGDIVQAREFAEAALRGRMQSLGVEHADTVASQKVLKVISEREA